LAGISVSSDGIGHEITMLYYPRRFSAWLGRRQCSVGDTTPYRGRADGQGRRRFIDRRLLAFGAFTWPMNGDVVLMT
jgi:hypothetical protein